MEERGLIRVSQCPPKAGWYTAYYYNNRWPAAYRYFDGNIWLKGRYPKFRFGYKADFGSHVEDRWAFR